MCCSVVAAALTLFWMKGPCHSIAISLSTPHCLSPIDMPGVVESAPGILLIKTASTLLLPVPSQFLEIQSFDLIEILFQGVACNRWCLAYIYFLSFQTRQGRGWGSKSWGIIWTWTERLRVTNTAEERESHETKGDKASVSGWFTLCWAIALCVSGLTAISKPLFLALFPEICCAFSHMVPSVSFLEDNL